MAQPTQTDPQFKLRLPADLKDRVQRASEQNNRSMNAEIVAALEEKYPAPPSYIVISEVYEMMTYIEASKNEAERTARVAEVNDKLKSQGASMRIAVSVDPTSGELATHMTVD